MNLKETNQKLERINLEKETKESILDLIDTKTDSDMKEVLHAIGALNGKLETSIGALKNEINTFDHKLETSIGSLNGKLETSIESLKGETKIVYWVVGIAMASITILLGVIGLIFAFKK